jgi:hypothetical protein
MGDLGIKFAEHMGGFFMEGVSDPKEGFRRGKSEGHPIDFRVRIHITPVSGFGKGKEPAAEMTGKFSVGPLGSGLLMENGEFNIFPGEEGSGMRHITYKFGFKSDKGEPFFFSGVKNVHLNRKEGSRADNVTLYSKVFKGTSEDGELYGAGVLRFHLLKDGPGLALSIRATGARSFPERLKALRGLGSM